MIFPFFFFNDTATTEIYTLSLHDALPICDNWPITWADDNTLYGAFGDGRGFEPFTPEKLSLGFSRIEDRKSTRLNSSHLVISYAVFCLKKKTQLLPTIFAPCERGMLCHRF